MISGSIELTPAATAFRYAEQVMEYKAEMLENGNILHGCAGLEDVGSFEEWIDFERRLHAKYGDEACPSDVYLAIRRKVYNAIMEK